MNIQIFGKSKCFDTKKAQRYFKERRIKFQAALIDEGHPDAALLQYLAYDADKLEKLLDNPGLLKTPIVRNGRQATVGYCPDVWKGWA